MKSMKQILAFHRNQMILKKKNLLDFLIKNLHQLKKIYLTNHKLKIHHQ